MFLLVGLGNIGSEYENTRHNLGFIIVDQIINDLRIKNYEKKFTSDIYRNETNDHKIIIQKPRTYMNNSGISVSSLKNFYKIPIENIFVFHDDLDISLGKIKIKIGGGAGGHNGLKSIDERIGKNYNRIRLGISRPENGMDVSNFVLSKFSQCENLIIKEISQKISNYISLLLTDRDQFLNQFYLT